MSHPIQIFEFERPGGLLPLAQITADIEEVAQRFDIQLTHWDEEGLGPARGAFVRSEKLRVFRLRELIHVREHLGGKFGVDACANDLAFLGSAELVNDLLNLLGIDISLVDWTAGEEGKRLALDVLRLHAGGQ